MSSYSSDGQISNRISFSKCQSQIVDAIAQHYCTASIEANLLVRDYSTVLLLYYYYIEANGWSRVKTKVHTGNDVVPQLVNCNKSQIYCYSYIWYEGINFIQKVYLRFWYFAKIINKLSLLCEQSVAYPYDSCYAVLL